MSKVIDLTGGYYKINSFEEALKCERLWSIENGITLCETCHINYHKLCGKNHEL